MKKEALKSDYKIAAQFTNDEFCYSVLWFSANYQLSVQFYRDFSKFQLQIGTNILAFLFQCYLQYWNWLGLNYFDLKFFDFFCEITVMLQNVHYELRIQS